MSTALDESAASQLATAPVNREEQDMRRFAVIMAGGSGERFWPASRRARPKQLLRLTDPDRSMLEEAIDRIEPLIPRENVIIATSELLQGPIREGIPSLPPENVIGEPAKRNTAACLALAAAHLEQRFGDPAELAMAVLTADHLIGDPNEFRSTVAAALDFAADQSALVTIGVPPTRADTGYGYIEVEEPVRTEELRPGNRPAIRPVLHFREKPDHSTAEKYASSGRHLWNAGMFFWSVSTFLDGLATAMPELRTATAEIVNALGEGDRGAPRVAALFGALDDISVDYGLMERAANVHVIPATFPWDDVGSWDSLTRTRASDADGNVTTGDPVLIDAKDCVIYDETGSATAVAVVGLRDVIVATTPDGILVCGKDNAQDVKKAVTELRRRGRENLT